MIDYQYLTHLQYLKQWVEGWGSCLYGTQNLLENRSWEGGAVSTQEAGRGREISELEDNLFYRAVPGQQELQSRVLSSKEHRTYIHDMKVKRSPLR